MEYVSNAKIASEKLLSMIIEQEGKLSFPIDPFKILKSLGVRLTFSDFDKYEGLFLFDDQNGSLVSINKNRPIQR